jgi:hypothetical protein
MSKTLFHYTPVFSAVMILRDGVIRRSSGPHVAQPRRLASLQGEETEHIPCAMCRERKEAYRWAS